MRIQELVLIGFKSFQEKTVLRFSPGINAIVGPNGCGKTNILDALRWVLGEQSFALLRCGRNEDLIFNGTATVPPTNYAEVRLVLATDDPASRVAEIELCRRYFRSGESEYYLNRQPCRLKDIQDVFLSSGTGTRAYSIFDLRQMREIISGNIRRMFEEAATLAKYQDAKDECQRKLALTEADLVRLDDIIAERERLVRSLARQAARLRAYNRLRAEENELQLIALKEEYDALVREKARVQTDVDALEQAGSARLDEINRLEETLKIQRAKLRDLQTARDQAQTLVQEQRRVVTELESKTLLARQQIDFLSQAAARSRRERETLLQNLVQLEQAFNQTLAQLAQANEQMAREQQTLETERTTTQAEEEKLYRLKTHDAALQHQLKELLEQQAALKGELARLQALKDNETEEQARLAEELTSLEAKMTQVQAELEQLDLTRAALQQDLIAHSRRSETLRTELAGLNQRLKEIQKTHDDLDRERVRREKDLAVLRYRAGTEQTEACRTILGDTLLGSVSQLLNIRPGWERAFEAALHHVADFLVTTLGPGSEQLTSLAQTRPDLCFGFLTLHSTPSPSAPPLPEDDAILAPLIQYVEFDPLTPASLQTMIRRTLVVASVRELQRLGPAHPDWSFVTQDGWCRAHDGRLVLAASASGKLGAARLAQEHTQNLAEIETEQTKLSTEQTRLLRRRSELENDLSERELQNADLQRQAHTHDALRNALAAQLDELQRDRDRLHTRQNRTSTAPASLTETQTRLAQTSARVDETLALLEQTGRDIAAQEQLVRAGLERSAELLAELSRTRETVSRLEIENTFAKRQIDDARRRAAELENTTASCHDQIAALQRDIASYSLQLDQARNHLARLQADLDQLQTADIIRTEQDLEQNLSQLRAAHDRDQTLLLNQRLQLHELTLRLTAITDQAKTSGTEITQLQPRQLDDASARLHAIRQRLQTLGQVNLLAETDYHREKQDLQTLRQQRDDVHHSRLNLLNTLSEIDRHARDQFLATWSKVRTAFQHVFRQLFLNGDADLILTDPSSPLQTEIAIIAKPQGKNPKRLEQLSDGEKALLALSLLLAFYHVKPAPFCFLDEIDAPLDDANATRLADYLRQIAQNTQIVIITHNRLTVERADTVFGVTAEQPGVSKLISVRLSPYRAAEPQPAPA